MGAQVMVMAGGTGGHVFPALAVAEELHSRGVAVCWLGTPDSFEARLVPRHGFPLETIPVRGLRGKGAAGWLAAPFRIGRAMLQARRVLLRRKPQLVLGMGGFAAGPGGMMARMLGIPLVVHEQNAIPGLTNQWLSRIATRVLEAFPGSFPPATRAQVTGNPVRPEIAGLPAPEQRFAGRRGALRLLVLGGSLGARALNQTVPAALALLAPDQRPRVRHQAGREKAEATRACYRAAGVEAEVTPFLDDMAAAYGWADLVICRAGALTVAELAAAGVGAVLVPYPYAVDDHQTRNARYLTRAGAARLLAETELDAAGLAALIAGTGGRGALLEMARAARDLGLPEATSRVAEVCQELIPA